MRCSAILLVALLLAAAPFAGFTYLYSFNGSKTVDPDDSYRFSQPTGVYVADGKLYVADSGRGALYVIDANVQGSALNGTHLINGTQRIRIVSSSDNSGYLANPMHMTYGNGLLYIAGGITGNVLTYMGTGSQVEKWNTGSNIEKASGMALGSGSMYISDMNKMQLLIYSNTTHAYSSIAVADGLSDGQLASPADVEFYNGKFFISDSEKNVIFAYDSNLTFLYSIGRNEITLGSPRGMQIYNNRIYVADSSASRVVVFSMDGFVIDVLDSSMAGGNLSRPEDVAISDGRLYVADTGNKLVRVFAINETSAGDDEVLLLLSEANGSLANLTSLQSAAQSLGISYQTSTLQSDLLSAQEYYNDSVYSAAATLAQTIINSAASQSAMLSQQVDTSVKQLVQSSQAKVLPYRSTGLDAALTSQLAGFDADVANVQSKLSAKSYPAAAAGALLLPAKANSFVSAVVGNATQAQAEEEQASENALLSQISGLVSRASRLKADAAAYRQGMDLSNAESLIAAAQNYTGAGEFDSANHSLSLAAYDISAHEVSLLAITVQIDAALANISVAEFEFNTTVSKPSLIAPDVSSERKLLADAKDAAYQNPQLAMAMAEQASGAAAAKAAESQKISLAAASLISMMVVVGFLAVILYVHLRGRKKAKEEGMAQQPRAKERQRAKK